MDFSKTNIQDILFSGIKNRFSDFSPYDFEDFIAQLFKDNGYDVEGTNYSGDYGADVITSKNGIKTAIQVKRYSKTNKVGVKDINQIIGGKEFHKCDKAMVVCTSDYTKQGIKLSKEADVELWNWEDLLTNIQETYLDGKNYLSFYSEFDKDSGELIFEYNSYEDANATGYADEMMLVSFDVTNTTKKNIYLNMYTQPILVTADKIQVQAISMLKGHSLEDETLFAGCKTDFSFWISKSRVNAIEAGDKFIFNLDVDGEDKTFESEVSYSPFKMNGDKSEFSLFTFMVVVLILWLLIVLFYSSGNRIF